MSAISPVVVSLKENESITGVIVSEHLLPYADSTGATKVLNRVGVCWESQRTPAISYHDPAELQWLSIPGVADEDDEDEEFEDGEETDADTEEEEA